MGWDERGGLEVCFFLWFWENEVIRVRSGVNICGLFTEWNII